MTYETDRLDTRPASAYHQASGVFAPGGLLAFPFSPEAFRVNIDYLAVLFRWLHILPAMVAVGGTIFMRMALVPTMGLLPEAQRGEFHEGIRSRWSKWVMGSIALLLVSGFYNFFSLNARLALPKQYQMLFGIKFLLALAIFAVASFLAGRTAVAQRMRRNPRPWLNLNITMAVLLVCISGVMRNISMNAPHKSAMPAVPAAAPPGFVQP